VPKPIRSLLLLTLIAWTVGGCATTYYRRIAGVNDWTAAQVMHRTLDRWVAWHSFATQFRLSVERGTDRVAARGHLIYLLGERIEFGFRKPWDRFIGTFYVIPDRTLYWGTSPLPQVYGLTEHVRLADILAYPFPDWDPRDFLPLPVSGRTGGLQPDSVWNDGAVTVVHGRADSVEYELRLSLVRGVVFAETVRRAGRDPLFKHYSDFKTMKGWAMPRRVVCTDSLGTFALSWSLSGLDLEAQDYMLEDTIQTFSPPAGGPR
jgi:hypothetical protein